MLKNQRPTFQKVGNKSDIDEVYGHNVEVFLNSFDFEWNAPNIASQMDAGWRFYSLKVGDEIVAALFIKKLNDQLLSKHSQIKMEYRGNGLSHRLKEFVEDLAKQEGLDQVVNICSIKDFRLISLNETHGYKLSDVASSNAEFQTWIKTL